MNMVKKLSKMSSTFSPYKFGQKRESPELSAYSRSAADSIKKSKNTPQSVQFDNPRHRNQFSRTISIS